MACPNLPLGVNNSVSPHTRKASILFYFFLPNSRNCLELILHRHSLCKMNKCVVFLMHGQYDNAHTINNLIEDYCQSFIPLRKR